MKPKTIAKPKIGRPSKYQEAYCEAIVAFMRQGYSATAFAGSIGVGRETISQWAIAHAEFQVALHAGKAACLRFWEGLAIKAGTSSRDGGAPAIIAFALRNMGPHDWTDKQAIELSGKDGGPISNVMTIEFVDAPIRS
ncbi:MAG: hypothetical protein KGQ46_07615 [Hyphomicrobiales bacterium]|nr:hypothetical protein [Hyphomicrobiales bacterium]MDE2114070.1 hypothetical protein [Hyphomicrobiales bacterium]